ncbi:MAG: hypothetical protein QNJ97_21355 [Myxococcota bacterium]|nr:hypothetical protein [Myxococcota bacterium]
MFKVPNPKRLTFLVLLLIVVSILPIVFAEEVSHSKGASSVTRYSDSATGAYTINFQRARNTTSTPWSVDSEDMLGNINFQGYDDDDSSYASAGNIIGQTLQDGDSQTYLTSRILIYAIDASDNYNTPLIIDGRDGGKVAIGGDWCSADANATCTDSEGEPNSALDVNGYLQIDTNAGGPSSGDCGSGDEGRMKFDTTNNRIAICDGSNWRYVSMDGTY